MSELAVVTAEDTGSGDKMVTAECVTDELFAIGGGASVSGAPDGSVAIVETRPSGLVDEVSGAWIAKAVELESGLGSWTLTVYAVCARVN